MYGQGGNSFLDVLEVKATPENLYEVANRQLGFVEIDNGMDFLASEVKNYAQAAMQEQPEHPLLFINQKSCGQLFTCEMQLTQKHHPSLGWSYLVATHRIWLISFSGPRLANPRWLEPKLSYSRTKKGPATKTRRWP